MTFLATILFLGLAGYITLRIRPKNPVAGLWSLSGYVLVFLVVTLLIINVLPRFFVVAQRNVSSWDTVWDSGADTVNEMTTNINQTIGLSIPQLSASDPQISVESLATAVPVATPQPIDTTTLLAPAQPAIIATPLAEPVSPTMTLKAEYYQALAEAKSQGDRVRGEAVINLLVALGNELSVYTQTTWDEIQQANAKVGQYQQLATIPASMRINEEYKQWVKNTLYGGTFLVVDDGAESWTLSCGETAVIRDITINAWTNGAEFRLPRCYVSQFGATETGDVFSVR